MAPEMGSQTEASNFASPTNMQQPAPIQFQQSTEYKGAQGYNQYPASYGQPFQPYQAYQMPGHVQQQQQQPYRQPIPEEGKAWKWTKVGLHGFDAIICICGLAVSLTLLHRYTDLTIGAVASAPIFAFALIWDIAELLTRFARKFKRGIHPGAHVALSLIIWLGAGVCGGILSAFAGLENDGNDYYECYNNTTDEYDPDCDAPWYGKRNQFIAAAALTCIVWLVHFILFVGACVDTAKRNAAAKAPIMIVSGPPYWGPAGQGYQPMAGHYAPVAPQQQQQLHQGQTQGPYMSVPQNEQYQQQQAGIPLQTRSPSPGGVSAGTGQREMTEGKGKGPETAEGSATAGPSNQGMTEYYTPRGN